MYRVTLKVNDRALLWNSLSKSSATPIKKSRAGIDVIESKDAESLFKELGI